MSNSFCKVAIYVFEFHTQQKSAITAEVNAGTANVPIVFHILEFCTLTSCSLSDS